MTSNISENVQVYLLSQAWSILAIRGNLEFVFKKNHMLKNLMLKILRIYFHFIYYYNTFQK